MKRLLIFITALIFFCGCFPFAKSQSDDVFSRYQYIKKYVDSEIDSIIKHNDYTIIYAWTEWCYGSKSTLMNIVFPFLKEIPENVGFISIFCGDADQLAEFLNENNVEHTVYILSSSARGLDKVKFNRHFSRFFNNYKSVNYVPIELLCNSQKQILNWNKLHKKYFLSYWHIKNNIFDYKIKIDIKDGQRYITFE
ncbi:MAG: hypothetical protein FWH18_08120 [Marinilabiliaceae bacterium]|nr:hypothetical protein [Marinilabiliaceae bacterium]